MWGRQQAAAARLLASRRAHAAAVHALTLPRPPSSLPPSSPCAGGGQGGDDLHQVCVPHLLLPRHPDAAAPVPLRRGAQLRAAGGCTAGCSRAVDGSAMCSTRPSHLLRSAALLSNSPPSLLPLPLVPLPSSHSLLPPPLVPLRSATSTATAWTPPRTRCSSSPPARASWSWRPRRWAVGGGGRLEPGWRAGQQAAERVAAAAAAQQGLASIAVRLLCCKHRLPGSAHGSPPPTASPTLFRPRRCAPRPATLMRA